MGCTSVKNQEALQIKNPPLRMFVQNCRQLGFESAQICKRTIFEYKYVRGLREWTSVIDKQLFIDDSPVLLTPCLSGPFQQILESVAQYKVKSLEASIHTAQINGFPKNLGLLISAGQKFPTFQCHFLKSNGHELMEYESGKSYVFVHWKLHKKQTIDKQVKIVSSRQNGIFKQTQQQYYETAFERAEKYLTLPNVILIGVCMDKPERKADYEQYFEKDTLHRSIWIEERQSFYSDDPNDLHPYECQAFQAFRFTKNTTESPIRGLDNSVFLVDQVGVFQGAYQENFCDETFVNQIRSILKGQHDVAITGSNTVNAKNNVLDVEMKYINLVKSLDSISVEDYKRTRRLIDQVVPAKVKNGSDWIQIGDTFSLKMEKYAYFNLNSKIKSIYTRPVLHSAASIKYMDVGEQLNNQLKNYLTASTLQDFRRRETIDKKAFFKMITNKMKEYGWQDIRFILERHQCIYYSTQYKRFVIDRKMDQLHNAPVKIGTAFTRKKQLESLKQFVLNNQHVLASPVVQLSKDFLSNVYGLTTSFEVGMTFSPIPNVYPVQHNESVALNESKIISSTPMPAPSVNASQQLEKQIGGEEPVDEGIDCLSFLAQWQQEEPVQEVYSEPENTLKQKDNEVLVIMQIDFQNKQQIQTIQQILHHVIAKGWNNEQIRVITIGSKEPDHSFDIALNQHRLEKFMGKGLYETWFAVEKCFNGANFGQLLEDLYSLDRLGSIIVIDTHKKLAYKGPWDNAMATKLDKIVLGNNPDTIYSCDMNLRNRMKAAAYEREWNIIKAFGYHDMKKNKFVQELEIYLTKHPLQQKEFWKLEIRSFQLWDQNANLVGKFYEKPRLGHRFERAQLQAKFQHLQDEILQKIDPKKIDILDLGKDMGKPQINVVPPERKSAQPIPGSLRQSLYQTI